MFYTSIRSIVLSGDIADYGMDATLDTIEKYKQFLRLNTNAYISISYNSNIENWQFKYDYMTDNEKNTIKSQLWDQFCSLKSDLPANIYEVYKDWRKISEDMLNDMGGSLDCGEQKVREDFSSFAGLKKEISFKEMLELEDQFNSQEVTNE